MYFVNKIIVNGKEYNAIPYDELTDSATKSEAEGYVSGRTKEGDMFAVCVLAIIVVFVLIFIVYKFINFLYIRDTIDRINDNEK